MYNSPSTKNQDIQLPYGGSYTEDQARMIAKKIFDNYDRNKNG